MAFAASRANRRLMRPLSTQSGLRSPILSLPKQLHRAFCWAWTPASPATGSRPPSRAGLTAGGASVESAGIITTPAVAFLAHTHRFAAGVVISASHNPWQDNGIKLFGPDGYKLPDTVELAIEEEIFLQLAGLTTPPQQTCSTGGQRSRPRRVCSLPACRCSWSLARWSPHRHRLR